MTDIPKARNSFSASLLLLFVFTLISILTFSNVDFLSKSNLFEILGKRKEQFARNKVSRNKLIEVSTQEIYRTNSTDPNYQDSDSALQDQRHQLGELSKRRTLLICLGIICFQGVKTIERTLTSYRTSSLLETVEEVYILFQKLDSPERHAYARDLARRYPELHPVYLKGNVGHKGFKYLASLCKADYTIILEEDFFIDSKKNVSTREQLVLGINLIEKRNVTAVKLRSRLYPGAPNYSYESWKRGTLGKTHLLSHVMWNSKAEDSFVDIKVCQWSPKKAWCAKSANANYSNNPVLYRTFFLRHLYKKVPPGIWNYEDWLTPYWASQDYIVAHSDGIFTHARLDRTFGRLGSDDGVSYRADHVIISSFVQVAEDHIVDRVRAFIIPLRRVYSGDTILILPKHLYSNPLKKLCTEFAVVVQEPERNISVFERADNICSQYHWCILTSIEGTIFQSDPFAEYPGEAELLLSGVMENITIGMTTPSENCKEIVEPILRKQLLSNRTIIGTKRGFRALKDGVTKLLDKAASCTFSYQLILNLAYYTGYLSSVSTLVQQRGFGIVNNLDYLADQNANSIFAQEGFVKNKDGTVSAVVQYKVGNSKLDKLRERLIKRDSNLLNKYLYGK